METEKRRGERKGRKEGEVRSGSSVSFLCPNFHDRKLAGNEVGGKREKQEARQEEGGEGVASNSNVSQ